MKDLIKRNTPAVADCFEVNLVCADGDYYRVESCDGKILITADSKISAAVGYYDYLKKYCGVNLSHCGNTRIEVDSAPLPKEPMMRKISQKRRVYLNYCTFGYSMRSWQWEDYEREIDYMAMNGINMPLSVVGHEAVMFYTLLDFGASEEQALSFISGPAFYPWQLMTNLDSVMSVRDKKYIDARLSLGRKIIERELDLGMTPILHGFAGHIPAFLADKFSKKSVLRSLPSWCGFEGTVQLDPLDENFTLFGRALLEKQKQLLGAFGYYACDPFHENEPPVDTQEYLESVGKTIGRMYSLFDPNAVWVMQSWSLREKIVKAIDKSRLLILDIDGCVFERTQGFWGYDFVLGTLHNFGDRNTLHGSIDLLGENAYEAAKEKYPSCCGTGLFMEGFYQNPLYYELAFEMLTRSGRVNMREWLRDYALRRYKSDEQCLVNALELLHESCYSRECVGRETGSMICARPSTTHYHTAPNDTPEPHYDSRKLLLAVNELLKARHACSDGYAFDVCDVLRQYVSNTAENVYYMIMDAVKNGDKNAFESLTERFVLLAESLDELLATRRELRLDSHMESAAASACCKKHERVFIKNELMLLTIWGPVADNELYDYSWREWAGLIKDFYLPRWRMFFRELYNNFGGDISVISDTPLTHNGRNDYDTTPFQKRLRDFELDFIENYNGSSAVPGDTLAAARKLLAQLSQN